MTQDAMFTQVRRWQFVALALIVLVFGYIAGQLTPTANAQPSTPLDTSGCTNNEAQSVFEVPHGTIVTAAYVHPVRQSVTYVYATCR